MRRFAPAVLLATVTTAASAVLAAPAPNRSSSPDEGRLIAIGDIHGAYSEFVEVLRAAELVDEHHEWSGGATTLVQTGDFLDRGTEVRRVMDLLMRLQREATEAGGRVVVLLGNHDAMNLLGDLRYVTPEIYATFASDDAANLQREGYREYERSVLRPDPEFRRASAEQRRWARGRWLDAHPPGAVEYHRAMAPDGVYGAWLRTLPLTARIDGVLYMHAAIAPQLVSLGVEALNERVAAEIATLDRYRAHLRGEGLITEFADVDELIRGAARATGGLDWLPEFEADLTEPPPLPTGELEDEGDARRRLTPLLRLQEWYLLAPEGPLWFRGLAQWDEAEGEAAVEALLDGLDLRALVGGHTTQRAGIRTRFGGRLILIDTGMNPAAYGGRPAALELGPEGARALYTDGSEESLEAPWLVETATTR